MVSISFRMLVHFCVYPCTFSNSLELWVMEQSGVMFHGARLLYVVRQGVHGGRKRVAA